MGDSETLTRADLAESLNGQIGLSRAESARMVETILDLMCDALARGAAAVLRGGVGLFIGCDLLGILSVALRGAHRWRHGSSQNYVSI